MKSSFLLAMALLAAPVIAAEPADEVKAAAKKLAEAGNYSWSSNTVRPESTQGNRGNFQQGPTVGKTSKGLVHLTRTAGERTSEAVVKGGKSASKTEAGWRTPEEARAAREAGGGGGGGAGGGQGGARRGGGFGFGFGNLENYKAPAEQVEALVGQAKELKKEGDAITGVLSEEAVKAQLTAPFGGGRRRDGGEAPSPTNTKGSVKFWLKDGALAKYETQVSGTMTFGDNEREIGGTTTVEIKDVGTTKVDVPEEALKKVEGAAAPKTEEKKSA